MDEQTLEIKVVGKRVDILNVDIILRTLKRFAGVIQQLTIEERRRDSNRTAITGQMTKGYTYDSLKYFFIGFVENNTFEQLAIQFPEVDELLFYVMGNEIKNQLLPLNQQFPKLRRLSIGLKPNANNSFL